MDSKLSFFIQSPAFSLSLRGVSRYEYTREHHERQSPTYTSYRFRVEQAMPPSRNDISINRPLLVLCKIGKTPFSFYVIIPLSTE
jgi:hypothetical protein